MSVINTNITSLIGQQNLTKSQNSLQTAMERLSSGLRINSAKDDAAGQAIANRMTAQITGLQQAQRNANDGISVAQTAEGALNQVNDNLQRVRELTVQAQNGTNSQSDLHSIQDEINQRLDEIDRISAETNFNGVDVLASDQALRIQVGANDGQTISIDLQEINAGTLDLGSFNVTGPVGELTGLTSTEFETAYGETTQVSSAQVDGDFASDLAARLGITIDTAGADDISVQVDENDNWFATVTLDSLSAADAETLQGLGFADANEGESFNFHLALDPAAATIVADAGGDPTVAEFSVDMNALNDNDFLLGATASPLAALDHALANVDTLRSDLGAIQNRFEDAITNLSTTQTNLQAARSRIEDADYAVEVANMTRAQILQQAGTSVLAQANQVPQSVLSLLG